MSPVPLPEDDSSLEKANEIFWQSLLDHIRREFHGKPVDGVLDVGCQHGGLLVHLASALRPKRLTGIEPGKPFPRTRSVPPAYARSHRSDFAA